MILTGILAVILSYLLGSIPGAYIITKIRKGIDIRTVDGGNVGAGSVFRQVGFVSGIMAAIIDIGKGSASILIAQALGLSIFWVMACGFAALLGHCFPLYIGFRGGQGVATIIGIFLVLAPFATLINLILVGIAIILIRQLFAAIYVAAPLLPFLIWLFHGSIEIIIYSLFIIIFVILKTINRFKEVPRSISERDKPALLKTFKSLLKR